MATHDRYDFIINKRRATTIDAIRWRVDNVTARTQSKRHTKLSTSTAALIAAAAEVVWEPKRAEERARASHRSAAAAMCSCACVGEWECRWAASALPHWEWAECVCAWVWGVRFLFYSICLVPDSLSVSPSMCVCLCVPACETLCKLASPLSVCVCGKQK